MIPQRCLRVKSGLFVSLSQSAVHFLMVEFFSTSEFFNTLYSGPQPPPMQFMLPEKALPETAEVAVIMGLHQVSGGTFHMWFM